ncbi:unnamed protein product [Polarella glacialis]|uniref:Uncharacterized protein n=1 Tax=Polarella glacialis TaxID=89957 RepID=A0A813I4M8_POLGL|nr:unnamed protein product [Polarella glacialis]CAE8644979.1 unnamed protein product [Polarella glacialis]
MPGERIFLISNDAEFRASFKRFQGDAVNGFNDAKLARLGQECIIESTFDDKTMTVVFGDSTRLDFPFESAGGYVE